MKNINLLLFFVLIIYNQIHAQSIFPQNKYKGKLYYSIKDYRKQLKNKSRVYGMSISYSDLKFFNTPKDTVGDRINNINIKNKWSVGINNRILISPLIIDLNGYYGKYKSSIIDTVKYKTIGAEVSISLILFPIHFKLCPYIQPYTGVGYMKGMVQSNEKAMKDYVFQSPIWKTGAMINLHQNFYFDFQYKQSMLYNKRNFNQWQAGVGLRGKPVLSFWSAVVMGGVLAYSIKNK